MRIAALLVAVAAGVSPAAFAAVYTCTDADGRTVFRDSPCARGERRADISEAPEAQPPTRKRKDTVTRHAAGPTIDRSKVERLVARLDAAMAKRDAKTVLGLLAQDAVVEVPASSAGTGTSLDKGGYGAYLGRVFGASGYVYRAAAARTSVSKSKPQASVTRRIRQTAWLNGRVAVVEVKERLTLEPQGRGLRILAMRKEVQAPGQASNGRPGGGA